MLQHLGPLMRLICSELASIIVKYPPVPTGYELWASDFNGDAEINIQGVVPTVNCIFNRPGFRENNPGNILAH